MAKVEKDYGNGQYNVKYTFLDKLKGGMLELVTKFGGFLNGKNADTSGIRNLYDEGLKNEAINDYKQEQEEKLKKELEKNKISQKANDINQLMKDRAKEYAILNNNPNNENPNLETNVNGMSFQDIFNQVDKWRQEDFERQDTAISRKIEDMRRAGVNPNLALNMNGLESTTNTSTDLITTYMSNLNDIEKQAFAQEFEKALRDYEIFMEQEFEGDQNDKDRIYGLFGRMLSLLGIINFS